MSKVVNFIVSLFWVTKDRAIAYGLTHHGSIYGVPSWVRVDGDMVHGCACADSMVCGM